MLAIRRLLNSCVLGNCEQTEISDSNKENAVRVVDVRPQVRSVCSSRASVLALISAGRTSAGQGHGHRGRAAGNPGHPVEECPEGSEAE